MTLTFHENGTATGLWSEDIPLHDLGPLTIERASTIEFNDAEQLWEVRLICEASHQPGPVVFQHPSRNACIAWEHRYFEQ